MSRRLSKLNRVTRRALVHCLGERGDGGEVIEIQRERIISGEKEGMGGKEGICGKTSTEREEEEEKGRRGEGEFRCDRNEIYNPSFLSESTARQESDWSLQ